MFRIARTQRAWKVNFIGLNAQDAGGPYRELMDRLCGELETPVVPLFVQCPNNRGQSGLNREKCNARSLTHRCVDVIADSAVFVYVCVISCSSTLTTDRQNNGPERV